MHARKLRAPAHGPLSHLVAIAVPLLAAVATAQAGEPRAPLPFERLFETGAEGRRPAGFTWNRAGTALAFLWSEEADAAPGVWRIDLAAAVPRRVVAGDDAVLDGAEIDAVHWSPDGGLLLIEAAGDLFLAPAAGGAVERLTETEADESDPKFAPDGSRIAFVRDHDLWLFELETRRQRALTTDGEAGVTLNGETDWVYWEELWGRDATGFWWSRDSASIAFYRFDVTPEGRYPLPDESSPYPVVRWQEYPKAGTANPRVSVLVIDLDAGVTQTLDTGPIADVYLPRVHWGAGRTVIVERLDRDQTRHEWLACDAGSGRCRVLIRDEHPTWVNVEKDTHVFADGRILIGTDRSGRRHLELYDAEGNAIGAVTRGDYAVTSLEAVDEEGGWVWVTATGEGRFGARNRRVLRVSLDGTTTEVLSDRRGWYGAVVAPATGAWVATFSDADHMPRVTLRAPGRAPLPLPHDEPAIDEDTFPRWEFSSIPGLDETRLPARLLRPAGASEEQPVPVIMYHYGGPGSQVVNDAWSTRGRDLWHKWMASRGYAILSVDNLGSSYFGKAGEDRLHRRFGEVNLAAQKAAVAWLEQQPWADGDRIGLWGWSGGGSNTLYCLLRSPGTWAAGVAGAPVTDWHLYDTIWTERYLDHPRANPDGYRASSALTYAPSLADPLLIVHGLADDNVHPVNTFTIVAAWVEAHRPFEVAIYPGQKHGLRGDAKRHFYERMTEFFDRHLRHQAPSRERASDAAPSTR